MFLDLQWRHTLAWHSAQDDPQSLHSHDSGRLLIFNFTFVIPN